jgi:hypothetical protein
MRIHHPNKNYCFDATPIQPSIWFLGRRVLYRREEQPVRSIEINRELAGTISPQLVTPSGQVPHHLQCLSCAKIVEPTPYKLCSLQIVPPNKTL